MCERTGRPLAARNTSKVAAGLMCDLATASRSVFGQRAFLDFLRVGRAGEAGHRLAVDVLAPSERTSLDAFSSAISVLNRLVVRRAAGACRIRRRRVGCSTRTGRPRGSAFLDPRAPAVVLGDRRIVDVERVGDEAQRDRLAEQRLGDRRLFGRRADFAGDLRLQSAERFELARQLLGGDRHFAREALAEELQFAGLLQQRREFRRRRRRCHGRGAGGARRTQRRAREQRAGEQT